MSDVLDQDEVNALLEAVEGGEIEVEVRDEAAVAAEVYLYDFKRPERVSKDQLRAMETLHEVFARNLSANLSGYLRTMLEFKLVSVEQLTYSEFILSLPNPTCFNLLSAAPLEGDIVLDLNHTVVFPIIERLLGGGKGGKTVVDRPLTEIEWGIISRIIERALVTLTEVWAPIKPVTFKVAKQESNPQLMQIVAPNEPVVLICFELTMGECSGMMNICIPFMVIEPIIGQFTTQAWFAYSRRGTGGEAQARMSTTLSTAKLDVECLLARAQIRLRDLLRLEVGDVIPTRRRAGSPALVLIEGRPKFWGSPGQMRGQRALRLDRVTGKNDHL